MNIALDKDVEAFLESQMREGVCSAPDQFVNNLIRSIRDQQRTRVEITPELEAWLLESADKPATPLTPDDFAGIRERARHPRRRS